MKLVIDSGNRLYTTSIANLVRHGDVEGILGRLIQELADKKILGTEELDRILSTSLCRVTGIKE